MFPLWSEIQAAASMQLRSSPSGLLPSNWQAQLDRSLGEVLTVALLGTIFPTRGMMQLNYNKKKGKKEGKKKEAKKRK